MTEACADVHSKEGRRAVRDDEQTFLSLETEARGWSDQQLPHASQSPT